MINNWDYYIFFRHYDFDLDKTLYFFIAGRYEFGNKGADIFIESLARLNHQLKVFILPIKNWICIYHRLFTFVCFQVSNSDVTVVAFLIFPTKTNNFNVESLRGQAVTKSLRDTINDIQQEIGKRMFQICLRFHI